MTWAAFPSLVCNEVRRLGGLELVNGDALSGALATDAITTSSVGAYAILQGSPAASLNYALTYTGANLTVTPRVLSVTADTLSRIYGNANPCSATRPRVDDGRRTRRSAWQPPPTTF